MSKIKEKNITAPQLITYGFATIILVGATLLSLPISSQTGEATNFLDALFTATSATCVTGLTTLTTATHWSTFGHLVILTMIELGALGFMSLPVLFYLVTRKKVGLGMRILLQQSLNSDRRTGEVSLMIYILKKNSKNRRKHKPPCHALTAVFVAVYVAKNNIHGVLTDK